MKPTFHASLVNPPFEDPLVYVRITREKRALLFDLGDMSCLDVGHLLKVSDVFVTHMHIDHFIGFDTLLRTVLRRPVPLRVYGPDSIIECIEGKLRGYAWNVIEQYPLKIEVFDIREHEMRHAGFYAQNNFRRVDGDVRPFSGIVMDDPPYRINAAILSHGIPCIAYSLEEDLHINIDKAVLQDMRLPVGPWLTTFKKMVRSGADSASVLTIDGTDYALADLLPAARVTKGQKLAYITDIAPDERNIAAAIALAHDSDTLYCEAYFLHREIARAVERNHLTARIAGEIAQRARAKTFMPMHFSSKYRECPDLILKEAMDSFSGEPEP